MIHGNDILVIDIHLHHCRDYFSVYRNFRLILSRHVMVTISIAQTATGGISISSLKQRWILYRDIFLHCVHFKYYYCLMKCIEYHCFSHIWISFCYSCICHANKTVHGIHMFCASQIAFLLYELTKFQLQLKDTTMLSSFCFHPLWIAMYTRVTLTLGWIVGKRKKGVQTPEKGLEMKLFMAFFPSS